MKDLKVVIEYACDQLIDLVFHFEIEYEIREQLYVLLSRLQESIKK